MMGDCDGYDFSRSENAARWKGLFTPSLRKVDYLRLIVLNLVYILLLVGTGASSSSPNSQGGGFAICRDFMHANISDALCEAATAQRPSTFIMIFLILFTNISILQDIEEKVRKNFPSPIDCWALNEAKETLVSKKRKSVLPTERVHTLLQKVNSVKLCHSTMYCHGIFPLSIRCIGKISFH